MTATLTLRRVQVGAHTELGRWADAAIATALVAAAALSGALLGEVIESRAAVLVGVAVAAAAGATAAGYRLASSRAAVLRTPIAALAAAVVGAALVAVVVARGPRAAWDAAIHGWAALATSAVPSPSEPRLVVPVALVTWAATVGSLGVWWRTRSRPLALLPVAAALTLACLAAGRNPWHPIVCGTLFVGAAAVVLGAGRASVTRGRTAALVRLGLFAGAAAIVAGLLGPTLALGRDDRAFEPREHLAIPLVGTDAETPLDLVAPWLQHDEPLFAVQADEPVRTRLVALDEFDGVTWRVSGEWRPAGAAESAGDATGAVVARRVVEAEVTVTGLVGPWLPSFGEHPQIEGVAAVVHPPSGSLASRSGSAAEATYTLVGDIPEPEPEALQVRATAFHADARRATDVPGSPPDLLVEMAQTATAGATTPFLKAFFLQRYLRSFQLDPESRAGHSYGHLERALTVTGVGTSEQFATGFAVLARIAGLPTRVVVGFDPGTDDGTGTFTVHSSDVVVWPEVEFEGIGWVPFDPTPSAVAGAGDNSLEVGGRSLELVNPPPPPTTAAPPTAPPVAADTDSGWTALALALLAAVVVVAALALTAVAVWKRRVTRTRRTVGDPRQRTLGAWHDVLDRLGEDDADGVPEATVEEVVGTRERTPLLWGLYRPVNRALYSDADLTDADADAAWQARDRLVAHLRDRDRVPRRVRRACDPRGLRRQSAAVSQRAGRRQEVE